MTRHALSPTPLHHRVGRVTRQVAVVGLGLFLTWLPGAAPLLGQALKEPLVPAGRVRLDFSPSISAWDTRYGIDADGNAVEEDLSADVTDPIGAALFPRIQTLQQHLTAMAPGLSFSPSVGRVDGMVRKDISRIDLSLEVGIFDWLTVGGTVPWVKNRTTVDVIFTQLANAELGVNPMLTAGEDVNATLQALAGAASGARAWAEALCQTGGDGCAAAQTLADRATTFESATRSAYGSSAFFPRSGSGAAGDLRRALSDLDTALSDAGLGSTGTVLPFATDAVDAETFLELTTQAGAGLQGILPLGNVEGLMEMGDVEVHATARLLEGEVRDSGAAHPRLSYALAAGGLVRLPTGKVDDPEVFLDMGTGDAQMDIEGRVFGALRLGRHIGFRGEFLYGIQRPYNLIRRVAPHEVAMPPVNTTRAVTWSPGDYLAFAVSPRWHLTDELSISGDYRYFNKKQDGYEIIGDATVGGVTVDPADLEHESAVTFQEVAVGLRYSNLTAWRQGLTGSPSEFTARYVRSIAGSGGRTPKATRLELGFRIFRRIWGENPAPPSPES